jgi:FKBP-type peptidyl-prolyl cis-trans isomerase
MNSPAPVTMRSFFYLLLLGVVLATIAIVVRSGMLARKNPGQPINATMREAMAAENPQLSTNDEALIERTYPNAHKLPSGLRYVVKDPGTGTDTPQKGHKVICNYAGRLLDGTEFDSSYRKGAPLTFVLGRGMVIKGWDEAFLLMHKGERATLIIPYWLAYGAEGKPPTIPPKATLIFEVELIDWR